MNIGTKTSRYLALAFLTLAPSIHAQLADTIWTGNAVVTIPAMSATDDNGNSLPYPKTTTALTFILPVEVWFWDNSKFLIVYRQEAMGADPSRGSLQPLIGEWTIPLGARVGQLSGISEVPYGSDLYEVRTGSVSKNGNKYSFTAEFRDTGDTSGYDSEWIYPGAKVLITGSFSLSGNTIKAKLTTAYSPNPSGPGGIKISGKAPSAGATLTQTDRKPSTEGVGAFLDDPD